MLQGLIAKKTIDIILKQVMKKREINKLRKYVEEDNELDIQMKQLQKTVAKQGKYIEELEKEVAILNKQIRQYKRNKKKIKKEKKYA